MFNIFKKTIFVFVFLTLSIQTFSQIEIKERFDKVCRYVYIQKDSNTIIYDPLDTLFQQIINNDFAFLFSDTTFYNCKIERIDAYNEGYGVLVSSIIDSIPVRGYIISAKNKDSKKGRIKVGKYYKMKLIRYFEKPLHRPIHGKKVHDVLLGLNLIPVLSTGSFCYIFVSPSLNGLSYIDTLKVDYIEIFKKKKEEELRSFIKRFITSISNTSDTNQLFNLVEIESLMKIFF